MGKLKSSNKTLPYNPKELISTIHKELSKTDEETMIKYYEQGIKRFKWPVNIHKGILHQRSVKCKLEYINFHYHTCKDEKVQ